MRILLTGASGFLGRNIISVLKDFDIVTLGRDKTSDISCDLSVEMPAVLHRIDTVVHAAGKAHVLPRSIDEEREFFEVNVNGTYNLLKGLEIAGSMPTSLVFISTVAVYGVDSGVLISEESPLNAKDPYGKSKIEAEHLVAKWCEKNKVVCTILRLPLLVGENPPGNLGSMIKAIKKGYYFNIDGGKAKKSMVMTADVAEIIPIVAKIGGIYNLTDGHHPSFVELSDVIARQLKKNRPNNIPLWIAKPIAVLGDIFGRKVPINTKMLDKIASDLTFDDRRAQKLLNWKPTAVLNNLRI